MLTAKMYQWRLNLSEVIMNSKDEFNKLGVNIANSLDSALKAFEASEKENAFLRELLTNFVEINRFSPEVKWIALDDLAKVVESTLNERGE